MARLNIAFKSLCNLLMAPSQRLDRTLRTCVSIRCKSSTNVHQQQHHGHSSDLYAKPRITLSRIAHPLDSQMLGSVHGGVLLTLMEEAGDIHCTRYCSQYHSYDNTGRLKRPVAVLGHVEKTIFLQPVKIGDVMQVETEVVYTSLRSLRAFVSVYALNFKGRVLACHSILWYVPINSEDHTEILSVPPLRKADPQLYEEGHLAYEKLRSERQQTANQSLFMTSTELIGDSDFVIQPVHCGHHSVCKGGPVMRWVDDCAGRTAIQFARVSMVTASIDSMRFYRPVPVGSYLSIVSRPVFSSKRTIDLVSTAYQQHFDKSNTETVVYEKVVDAILTFAAFKKDTASAENSVLVEIEPETDEDKKLFEERKQLYLARKSRAA